LSDFSAAAPVTAGLKLVLVEAGQNVQTKKLNTIKPPTAIRICPNGSFGCVARLRFELFCGSALLFDMIFLEIFCRSAY
jgi:hypothetical protein